MKLTHQVLSLLIIALCVHNTQAGRVPSVSCSGYCVSIAFRGDPALCELLYSNYSDFRVTVAKDGRYLLTFPEPDLNVELYLAFDGVDTYTLRYEKNYLTNTNSQGSSGPDIPWAEVSRGCFPYDNPSGVGGVLWLAFGSGTFFHTNRSSAAFPLPFRSPRLWADVYGFRFEAQLQDQEPYLPKEINYFRDSKADLPLTNPLVCLELNAPRDPEHPDKYQRQIRSLKRWYPTDGFRGLHLISDNFTNVNQVTVPQTVTVHSFNPKWPDLPVKITTVKVTEIKPVFCDDSDFRPPIKGLISVTDNRFRFRNERKSIDFIIYGINPKDGWRPATDPLLLSQFRAEGGQPVKMPNITFRRFVMVCLIIFVFSAYPVWLLWKHVRAKPKA